MKKNISSIAVWVAISCAAMFAISTVIKHSHDNKKAHMPIDKMPLIIDDPFAHLASFKPPTPERGVEVLQWLEPGVRIKVPNAWGSGTIIWYDEKNNYAYVQSCGHFWEDNMSASEAQNKNLTVKVQVFYKNKAKLTQPAEYTADVLFYHNNPKNPHLCQDCSLFKFKPDYKPSFFPIAPIDYVLQQGQKLHSVGCDEASEVAHYSVRVIGERGSDWPDLVTTENSPRPGRSGGGLISDDNLFVGICWGTSDYSGTGNGYFTPLRTIRYYNEQNGYGWLNDLRVDNIARKIPILDRNNPQGKYSKDYICLPNEK